VGTEENKPPLAKTLRSPLRCSAGNAAAAEPIQHNNRLTPSTTTSRARFGYTASPCPESVVHTNLLLRKHSRLSSRIRRSTRLWFACQPRRRASNNPPPARQQLVLAGNLRRRLARPKLPEDVELEPLALRPWYHPSTICLKEGFSPFCSLFPIPSFDRGPETWHTI